MKEDLLKIVKNYGISNQVRKFNEECFELQEAIIRYEEAGRNYYEAYDYKEREELKQHIAEEIGDVLVMVYQFVEYYNIDQLELLKTMDFKVNRQLERIKGESNE